MDPNAAQGGSPGTVRMPIAGGRSRPVLVVAVIVFILAIWILGVILLGQLGGPEQAASRSGPGSPQNPRASSAGPPEPEPPQSGPDYGGADYGGAEDGGAEDNGGPNYGGGSTDYAGATEGGDYEGTDYASATESGDSVPGYGSGAPDGGAIYEPDGGVTSTENVSYTNPGSEGEALEPYAAPPGAPQELTDTAEARARTTSERFVSAAYGYTGTSNEDYLAGIERYASEAVFASPGGQRLKQYAEAAPRCGMRSTAVLDRFEIAETAPQGVAATAYFTVTDGSREHTFSQNQILKAAGGGNYEVIGVAAEKLTSGPTPRESCPGNLSGQPDSDAEGPLGVGTAELDPDQAARVEEAIRAHYEAIGRTNFEEAYDILGPSYRAMVPRDPWIAAHRAEGIESSEVESVRTGANRAGEPAAFVRVSFVDAEGEHTFELVWVLIQGEVSLLLDVQTYGAKVSHSDPGGGG